MKITRKELKEIIEEVATELGLFEGLTAAQEKLPEPLKAAILKKQESEGDADEEEAIEEGNAFGDAVRKARENGDEEFEVGGKTYPLKEKVIEESEDTEEFTGEEVKKESHCHSEEDDADVEEGNAFGDAVRKAKEAGEDEFEVGGKTYQVKEIEARKFKNATLSETLARIQGNKKIL